MLKRSHVLLITIATVGVIVLFGNIFAVSKSTAALGRRNESGNLHPDLQSNDLDYVDVPLLPR